MIHIHTHSIKILADLTTPVSLFLKLREHFPEILLLESSDYSSKEDSQSFICFDPLLTLKNHDGQYELKNHLGNVMAVVSDRKYSLKDKEGRLDGVKADVRSLYN